MLKPIIEELEQEFSQVRFYKLNVEEHMELATKYGVTNLPTIFLIKD
ncbi:thioredoxin family protein [Candidatus Dojkabacteria bacterium]|jgi:thioredoxin 1|nr:thioredoxin family protein [Candidatus Dojkabacteria bacterium]